VSAGIQSPRNDSASVVVSTRLWQVYQPVDKSRKSI